MLIVKAKMMATNRYEIKRISDIIAESVFFEVWDIVEVDEEKRTCRIHDRVFKTETEAQDWISRQV